MPTLLKEVQ